MCSRTRLMGPDHPGRPSTLIPSFLAFPIIRKKPHDRSHQDTKTYPAKLAFERFSLVIS